MILGIPSRPGLRVMVASKPVDFRKGMDGLAAMVTQALASDPFAGDVFVFRAKRTDRIKLHHRRWFISTPKTARAGMLRSIW